MFFVSLDKVYPRQVEDFQYVGTELVNNFLVRIKCYAVTKRINCVGNVFLPTCIVNTNILVRISVVIYVLDYRQRKRVHCRDIGILANLSFKFIHDSLVESKKLDIMRRTTETLATLHNGCGLATACNGIDNQV